MIRAQEIGNLIKEALIEQEDTKSKIIRNSLNLFNESVSIFMVTIPEVPQQVNFKPKISTQLD